MFFDKFNYTIMNINLKDFIIIGLIVLVLDFIAFKLFITAHFSKLIKQVQHSDMSVNYFGAGFAYLFITLTIYIFIIKGNLSLLHAGLLGFFVYGIYETTNFSILKDWTILTILIDSIWGGILFFTTTFLFRNFKKYIN
jgi:uncharacterized membrane protein